MQVILLSATIPEDVQHLSRRFAPRHVSVKLNSQNHVPLTVKHIEYKVSNRRKVRIGRQPAITADHPNPMSV